MGAIIGFKKKGIVSTDLQDSMKAIVKYDEDVEEAANFSIARQEDNSTTNLELYLQCKDLPKMDAFSLTDPLIVVYTDQDNNWIELGRTEVIQDNMNPKFSKTFIIAYNPEKTQNLRFVIYDVDDFKDPDNLLKHELVGTVEMTLQDISWAPSQTLSRSVMSTKKKRKKNNGDLIVRASPYEIGNGRVVFHIGARNFMSKNELAIKLSGMDVTRQILPFYISERKPNIKKGLEWKPFTVNSNRIYDESTLIKFEIHEYKKNGEYSIIGEMENSLMTFMSQPGKHFKVMKNGLIIGELKILEVKRVLRHSFLNYVKAGAQISLMTCFDFTNSNLDQNNSKSLHYLGEDGKNDYITALQSVGAVLQAFDHDQRIPLYGFGAKLPPYHNIVSHCFALNGNYFDPEVYELQEAIEVYRQIVPRLKFHGPSIFSEIIKMAAEIAGSEEVNSENQKYYILLIYTDGIISDIENTINELVKASLLPLSIIIIGVGNEDFSSIKTLESVDELLSSKSLNQQAERDIVHFVPFRKYAHDRKALTREVLANLPRQFLEYMGANGIEPQPSGKGLTNQETIQRNSVSNEKRAPQILITKKEEFYEKLLALEFNPKMAAEILEEGIPTPDVNLVIEIANRNQKLKTQDDKQRHRNNKIEASPDADDGWIITEEHDKLKKKIKQKEYKINHLKTAEVENLNIRMKQYLETTKVLIESKERDIIEAKRETLGDAHLDRINPKFKQEPKRKPPKAANQHIKLTEDQTEHFKLLTTNKAQVSTDENECVVCKKNLIEIIVLPCGHAATCHDCFKLSPTKCFICKNSVTSYLFSN